MIVDILRTDMAGKKGQKKRFWSDEEKVSICAQTCAPGVSVARSRSHRGRNGGTAPAARDISAVPNKIEKNEVF